MSVYGSSRRKKRAGILCFLLVLTVSATLAQAADAFSGWTEEKREEAWMVYRMTDWNAFPSLDFTVTGRGALSKAEIPDAFRTAYEPVLSQVLQNSTVETVFYDPENQTDKREYKELLLAAAYVMHQKGGEPEAEGPDVCGVRQFLDEDYAVTTPADSFQCLFERYAACEQAYVKQHEEAGASYRLFSDNPARSVILQAVCYGEGYAKTHEQYSSVDAGAYYEAHSGGIPVRWDRYAEAVLSIYQAVEASQEESNG